MRLNQEKSRFHENEVDFLGYQINKDVHAKRENLEAILDVRTHVGVPELRSSLGLVTYYKKFLPQAATILAPLYELLHARTEWKWGVPQQQPFEEVKALIRKAEFLAH